MGIDPWQDAREAWRRLEDHHRTGGPADAALEALSDIGTLRRLLDQAELEAVRNARRGRRSWAEIATRLGVTRQSAWERWRELDEEPRDRATPEDLARVTAAEAVTATARDQVTVPDLVGLSWQQAQRRLLEVRLHAVSADPDLLRLHAPDLTDLLVVEQKPAAGERVAPSSPVTLWLRRGPGSAGVHAPLEPRPTPRTRRGAIDEESGESVR